MAIMYKKIIILLTFILVITSCVTEDLNQKYEINTQWKFRQADSAKWYPAKVPGTVHTNLLNNKLIPDPFYKTNEELLQWIDKQDWEFKTSINLKELGLNFNKNKRYSLVFDGIDTYAEVSLNDSLLGITDNMFVDWEYDVTKLLQKKNNNLKIRLRSPIKEDLPKLAAMGYQLPAQNDQSVIGGLNNNQVSIFARKAPYHYGWDWGPRLVTSGIWRKIWIKEWENARIENVHIINDSTIYSKKAKIKTNWELLIDQPGKYELNTFINGGKVHSKTMTLNKSHRKIFTEFAMEDPELWWPKGMGDQKLYEFEFELLKDGTLIDKKKIETGLRIVEVIQETDSIGCNFYFKVNGLPVFMKGANYIPGEVFLDKQNKEYYDRIIALADNANMNMLRVWGGGIYEDDYFYELCNKKGILIWQDFMFACSMYPGDEKFLQNVKKEADYNIKRLRNNPSIALWCGNNEILDAWNRWGWQERFTEDQKKVIWSAYEKIFYDVLANSCKENDNTRFYWPSSPSSYYYNQSDIRFGDFHYWGVWHGNEPFEMFNEQIGRFLSEYGFQSFPEMKTIKSYTTKEDWDIESKVMMSHQRSPIGNERIKQYMDLYYKTPKDFESFIYVGQLLQGEAMKTAIEAHRRNRPICMGSLYWQLNDCWPVASWASTDYYRRWKAAHYMIKKAFDDISVHGYINKERLEIHIFNDRLDSLKSEMKIKILDFNGNTINSISLNIKTPGNTSAFVWEDNISKLLKGKNKNEVFAVIEVTKEKKRIAVTSVYFAKQKDLKLPAPDFTYKVYKASNGYQIEFKTKTLLKNLFIDTKKTDVEYSDNYFDLFPGEIRTIFVQSKKSFNIQKELKIRTLFDTY